MKNSWASKYESYSLKFLVIETGAQHGIQYNVGRQNNKDVVHAWVIVNTYFVVSHVPVLKQIKKNYAL